jgi:hypothetical protein
MQLRFPAILASLGLTALLFLIAVPISGQVPFLRLDHALDTRAPSTSPLALARSLSGTREQVKFPIAPAGGQVFFTPPLYPQAGAFTSSIAVGDFNRDGKLDLAVANQCEDSACQTGGVTIFLGNRDGTFQTGATYSTGGYEAYSITAGDLNHDGKIDLVVANGCQSPNQCGSGAVGILLGNGDGTFKTANSYPSGGVVASSVVIAYLNQDRKPDLAVANQCEDTTCSGGGVSVLLGNGDGTFGPAQSYSSGGYNAIAVNATDFTGEGKRDLAVVNQCQSVNNCNGSIGVLLGNGDGTFQSAQVFGSGGYTAYSVAAADLNGDGKPDIVVANQCQSATNCSNGIIGVLQGNGDGTFQTAQTYSSSGTKSSFVGLGDFNGDSHTDLLVVDQCESDDTCSYGSVSLLLGNGDGTFQPAQGFASEGVLAISAAIADLNGDHKLDTVVANECQSSSNCSGLATVMLGNGDGTFRVPPAYAGGGYNTDAVAVGDLNGDGKPDLVVSNLCQTSSCTGQTGLLTVLTGNGHGTFQTRNSYSSGGYGAVSVAVGDLNGDGNLDVVVANQCSSSDCTAGGGIGVLLGNGDGTLQSAQTYQSGGYTASSIAIADVNGDGKADLIVANQCQTGDCQSDGNVSVLLGNGDGTFQPAQSYPAVGYNTVSLAIADFNRDGHPDIALASECADTTCQNGLVSVLLGNGDGTFQAAKIYDSLGSQADSIVVADFNGDGKPDLAVSNLCQHPTSCNVGWISVLPGNGDGTFRAGHHYVSGGQYAYSVSANDFNGDGFIDLVVATSGGTALLLNTGHGRFQSASIHFPGGVFVQNADLNGDGQPDLVVGNGLASTATILLNVASGYRHTTTTTLTSSPNPSGAYESVLFTATVTSQFRGMPTGTVTFMDGTTALGEGTLTNGQATLNYSFPSPGLQKITADYSGDNTFLPSTSRVLKQKVSKAKSTTVLTSMPNPSQFGQTVTFTATVEGRFGGTPTGTVEFKGGHKVLATVPLTNGVAIYQTSTLPKGKDAVRANYSGDASFEQSKGYVLQIVK